MKEFFKLQREPEIDIVVYVAKVEKLSSDMNTELRRRRSHDIPIELLYGQILATVAECQEVSNIWESVTTSERRIVCLIHCVRSKNGCRHARQRQSQVHSWHMRQPRSLNRWRSEQRRVNQVVRRSQPKTTEKTTSVFIVGRLAI